MQLKDFFERKNIIRDKEFNGTYNQHYDIPLQLVCFLNNISRVSVTNNNQSITAVITTKELAKEISEHKGVVVSKDPIKDFYALHNEMVKNHKLSVIHKNYISPESDISKAAHIGSNVYIGKNVSLGHGVIIHDNSYIDENTFVDDYSIIGAKGIQYPGALCAGGVKIGKNCEIRSFSIIGRPYQAFYTNILDNTRIGQKVTVAHGCQIGEGTFIATNSSLAGNCVVGENVYIGLSSTLCDVTKVGSNAIIRAGSIVINNIKEKEEVSGNFAYSHKRNLMDFIKRKRITKKK